MRLFLSALVLAFSVSALAADPATTPAPNVPQQPNQEVKEKVEDIKGTIVKPTTEQTAAVSKAAVRAKKLKKKHKKD
ncbi:MAG: hypothetical protein NDI63_07380 [Pseudobdellovibrio sp.]|nr:hypothetical protein [Pseudobdellovibrio sp.]